MPEIEEAKRISNIFFKQADEFINKIKNHDKDCKCITCLTKEPDDCILSPLCKCEDCKDYNDTILAPDQI